VGRCLSTSWKVTISIEGGAHKMSIFDVISLIMSIMAVTLVFGGLALIVTLFGDYANVRALLNTLYNILLPLL
jgi:hypothetical protein